MYSSYGERTHIKRGIRKCRRTYLQGITRIERNCGRTVKCGLLVLVKMVRISCGSKAGENICG